LPTDLFHGQGRPGVTAAPGHFAVPFEGELEVDGDGLVANNADLAGQAIAVTQHVTPPRQGDGLEIQSRPLFAFSGLRISRDTGLGVLNRKNAVVYFVEWHGIKNSL
jgi:hypothetical protein